MAPGNRSALWIFRIPDLLGILALLCASPCALADATRTLWVWERPEDLRSFPSTDYRFAIWQGTVRITEGLAHFNRRTQEALLPRGAEAWSVFRIEVSGTKAQDLTPELAQKAASLILRGSLQSAGHPHPQGIQIDFDATQSQRSFYRAVLQRLRKRLPRGIPLSITALASWCMSERSWINELPVDSIVPMVFELGPATYSIWSQIHDASGFRNSRCRANIGLSLQEDYETRRSFFRNARQFFLFNRDYWRGYWKDFKPTSKNEDIPYDPLPPLHGTRAVVPVSARNLRAGLWPQ